MAEGATLGMRRKDRPQRMQRSGVFWGFWMGRRVWGLGFRV